MACVALVGVSDLFILVHVGKSYQQSNKLRDSLLYLFLCVFYLDHKQVAWICLVFSLIRAQSVESSHSDRGLAASVMGVVSGWPFAEVLFYGSVESGDVCTKQHSFAQAKQAFYRMGGSLPI